MDPSTRIKKQSYSRVELFGRSVPNELQVGAPDPNFFLYYNKYESNNKIIILQINT